MPALFNILTRGRKSMAVKPQQRGCKSRPRVQFGCASDKRGHSRFRDVRSGKPWFLSAVHRGKAIPAAFRIASASLGGSDDTVSM